ncbi:MAG: FMN-binding protein [Phycisphaeraceae bacterium]|nr:FMN-binding protein [Phycisphaeraceae bacterium]
MSKIKFFITQSWLLIVAALFFGVLLAGAQTGLNPLIEANEQKKLSDNMKMLITDATDFVPATEEALEISVGKKTVLSDVYKGMTADGDIAGYAFIAEGAGFADKIKLVIATDSGFTKYMGYKVMFSNETPGFGDKIKNAFYSTQYVGAPIQRLELTKAGDNTVINERIVAISGATVSSDAVIKIFNTFGRKIKSQLQAQGVIQ